MGAKKKIDLKKAQDLDRFYNVVNLYQETIKLRDEIRKNSDFTICGVNEGIHIFNGIEYLAEILDIELQVKYGTTNTKYLYFIFDGMEVFQIVEKGD